VSRHLWVYDKCQSTLWIRSQYGQKKTTPFGVVGL
jgi:hypothetical protein